MFVYHRKQDNMVGTVLYPLTVLQQMIPEVYIAHKAKYEGREAVMDIVVPLLGCKWNDVIHMSPMHPNLVYRELAAAGLNPDPQRPYFKIPVQQLCQNKTVIYTYERAKIVTNDDQFVPFDIKRFENLTSLPKMTKEYYHACATQGIRPLLFHHVPHVMTMGAIETENLEVICWSQHQ